MPALKIALICLVVFLGFYLFIRGKAKAWRQQEREVIDESEKARELSSNLQEQGNVLTEPPAENLEQELEVNEEMPRDAQAVATDGEAACEIYESEPDDSFAHQIMEQPYEEGASIEGIHTSKECEFQSQYDVTTGTKSSACEDNILFDEKISRDPLGDLLITDERKEEE